MNENAPAEPDFLVAMSNDDQAEIIRLFPVSEFYLLEIEEEGSENDEEDNDGDLDEASTSALTAEVDDFVALVAFTSSAHVEAFCDESELFDEDEPIPCLVMKGTEIIDLLPDELGILFNPESEDAFVFSPEVFRSFKTQMIF